MDNKAIEQPAAEPDPRVQLAFERTFLAYERTRIAWVRTALSLQSFGFTIYKVLQAFQQERGTLRRDQTPANVGLFLTGMGTLAIVMGIALLLAGVGFGILSLKALPATDRKEERAPAMAAVPTA